MNKNDPASNCLMAELIDDFFADYPSAPFRQYLIDRLMREIMKFDGEFRREDAAGSVAPERRHLLLVLNEPPAHGAATARQQPSPTHPPKPTGAR
jgi:hypothetical protein